MEICVPLKYREVFLCSFENTQIWTEAVFGGYLLCPTQLDNYE
jgi:hypothetical protein